MDINKEIYSTCFNPKKVKIYNNIKSCYEEKEVPCGNCYHCLITKPFLCKEGDVFKYKGVGRANGYSALFYNNVGAIISYVQYNTPSNYVDITAPQNSAYVIFSSFAAANETITFDVKIENSMDERVKVLETNNVNNNLLNGKGCPMCYNNRRGDSLRKTHEEFIKELAEILKKINGENVWIHITHDLFGNQNLKCAFQLLNNEEHLGFLINGQEIYIEKSKIC